jgi:hypothetical protein
MQETFKVFPPDIDQSGEVTHAAVALHTAGRFPHPYTLIGPFLQKSYLGQVL